MRCSRFRSSGACAEIHKFRLHVWALASMPPFPCSTSSQVDVCARLDRMLESLDLAPPELDNAQREALKTLKALGYLV